MCGIIAYLGKKESLPILIKGLRRLEYRGYDSAGVAVIENGEIRCVKSVGKIDNLSKKIGEDKFASTVGIAHTRWATHGGVTEANTHPHSGCKNDFVIVHNGIVENYRELKEKFLSGHTLKSETDTEILAHLIEVFYEGDLLKAVQKALAEVRGTYGLVVMHKVHPEKLIAARLGSPLVIGVGQDEYFLASDTSPFLSYTRDVIFLNDGEIVEVGLNGVKMYDLNAHTIDKKIEQVEWNESQAEKQGFDYFMLKEIYDQPTVYLDAIRGRYNLDEGTAHLGGLDMTIEQMHTIKRVVFLACGTSSYAAMVGKSAFERLAGLVSEVCIASEFRYSDPILDNQTLVFALSQSGETADTLAAVKEAKRKGAVVKGIINVVGSTIARECKAGTYIHAGPELAVASTKAFTNTIAVLLLYALQFGRLRRLSVATGERLLKAMLEVPEKMQQVLAESDKIKLLAEKYSRYKDFYFLGRGINFITALEGSLKLKEISYRHSEAYPAGELKHGPIALVSEEFPIIATMTQNQLYEKMRSNIEELRARKAPLVLIATSGDQKAKELTDDVIYVPPTMELLEPLINTVALQLFAYHMAVTLGRDVDRPRNLAKSVTVE